MSLVIASQLEPGFNDGLRIHPIKPLVIDVDDAKPWEAASDADILLVRPTLTWRASHALPQPAVWPGRLRWVLSSSAGVDFYPPWLLRAPLVTCGRGVASEEIADYVIAAIYAHSKNLEGVRARSREAWKQQALGRVAGSTVGIVGFGTIGQAVARRALALGAKVQAVRRRPLTSDVDGVELLDNIEALVAAADHIVIAVPSTPQTRHLFDARLLAHARPHAHLINIARGAVVDQEALVAALDAQRLAFATLDVTDPEPLPEGHPLYSHPLVRLTPHVSSNYTAVRHLLQHKVAEDLSRFARGETPADVVDPLSGY